MQPFHTISNLGENFKNNKLRYKLKINIRKSFREAFKITVDFIISSETFKWKQS